MTLALHARGPRFNPGTKYFYCFWCVSYSLVLVIVLLGLVIAPGVFYLLLVRLLQLSVGHRPFSAGSRPWRVLCFWCVSYSLVLVIDLLVLVVAPCAIPTAFKICRRP